MTRTSALTSSRARAWPFLAHCKGKTDED
jgi:hypothetical protein